MLKEVGDCVVITFYYLLPVGEYIVKNKETKQIKWCSSSWKIQFLHQDDKRHLHQLTINALDKDIFSTYGATLKLDNRKIDEEGCVFIKNTMEMKFSAQ